MNRDGLGAGAFQLGWLGIFSGWFLKLGGGDRDGDLAAQFHALLFVVHQGADRAAGNVFAFESDRRSRFGYFGILMIDERISLHLQSFMRFDLHVAVELTRTAFLVINGAVGNDLIGLVAFLRKHLEVDALELVMTVRVRNVA